VNGPPEQDDDGAAGLPPHDHDAGITERRTATANARTTRFACIGISFPKDRANRCMLGLVSIAALWARIPLRSGYFVVNVGGLHKLHGP
jgi:hypothetical protein